ncbi:dihydroorotate dehydrogenase electron transfer subunit [Candidatus Peregrinibacteria bacterium RIFOXYB2_FULL_32_7]|nr:MAG: dihydroorotate dehydrogenase electron transfer subunit [Candidatus Peregrinibacteria bacterium RIFOXYB2_FULL_32_7]
MPKSVKILDIVQENSLVKTYTLDISLHGKPGQFCNIWIPRLNEKPFSVADDDGKVMKFSIAEIGPFTQELAKKKVGDKVGIRGPYGKGFEYKKGEHLVFLAGGYGAAPLYFLARQAGEDGCEIEFIVGARSENLLLYIDKIKKLKNVHLHIATDDGSKGYRGYNIEVLKEILLNKKIDHIYTCGPEIMMKKVSEMAFEKNIPAQISVERYMKCGFGICGNCVNDGTGAPSCKKGPVMSNEEVRKLKDFGQYHRDEEGMKVKL